eukprot:1196030-Prorocentrum_minimum.AAC.3
MLSPSEQRTCTCAGGWFVDRRLEVYMRSVGASNIHVQLSCRPFGPRLLGAMRTPREVNMRRLRDELRTSAIGIRPCVLSWRVPAVRHQSLGNRVGVDLLNHPVPQTEPSESVNSPLRRLNSPLRSEREYTTQETEFTTQEREFTTQETEFTTQEREFTTQETEFTTQERDFATETRRCLIARSPSLRRCAHTGRLVHLISPL